MHKGLRSARAALVRVNESGPRSEELISFWSDLLALPSTSTPSKTPLPAPGQEVVTY